MEERESTLEDKEKGILELRRKNITLDNFRFVLDHRVQQLMEERGPITRHIEVGRCVGPCCEAIGVQYKR